MDRDSESGVRQSTLIAPWQDPNTSGFYSKRPEDQHITVKLSRGATEHVWNLRKMGYPGYVIFTFEGEVWVPLDANSHGVFDLTFHDAVQECLKEHVFAYGMTRRRAWRPVWRVEREKRTHTNFSYERVELMGYKGLSDHWKDRPKARMFDNDV